MKEFNHYPNLEKCYGEMAFEINKRDMELVDKIIERHIKMCSNMRKHKEKYA